MRGGLGLLETGAPSPIITYIVGNTLMDVDG